MKRKGFQFNGLGFPIILVGVRLVDGVPDINFNHLADSAFEALARKPSRLSGAEVKFIRQHLRKTQEEFAVWLLVERSSVTKWEKKDLESTGMAPPTEAFLRLQIVRHLKGNLNNSFPAAELAVRTDTVGEPIQLPA